jgi:CRISPR-associated protein Cas2
VNLIVVSYDISHPRRLRRVARLLEGYGERVQESVFECWLAPGQLAELQRRLGKEMNAEKDRIRYYCLCAADAAGLQLLGRGQATRDRPWVAL